MVQFVASVGRAPNRFRSSSGVWGKTPADLPRGFSPGVCVAGRAARWRRRLIGRAHARGRGTRSPRGSRSTVGAQASAGSGESRDGTRGSGTRALTTPSGGGTIHELPEKTRVDRGRDRPGTGPRKDEFTGAKVAQLVEQRTENPCVDGSIPPLRTIFVGIGRRRSRRRLGRSKHEAPHNARGLVHYHPDCSAKKRV